MLCTGVRAQTVTECERSDGYSYHFAGGLVPADKSGWQKDGYGGRQVLNFINGEFDLLGKKASGTARPVKQDGGKIIPRKKTYGLISITLLYSRDAANPADAYA